MRSPFEEERRLWESVVRWGLNDRAPERDVTEPERLLDRGRGSCDRRLRLCIMLSRGDGASPTQLPVRTGGGRRFGDRAGCWLFWYRATGSSSKSTAVGPDWARCGSGRTAAAILLCGRAAGSCAASTSTAGRVERLATHTAGLPLVTAPRRRVGLSVWASVADRDPLRAYCPAIVGLGPEEWLQVAAGSSAC